MLKEISEKFMGRRGYSLCLFITFIKILESDRVFIYRENTRLRNNRSFDVTSNISDDLFERTRFTKIDVSIRRIPSDFTVIVIKLVEETTFYLRFGRR